MEVVGLVIIIGFLVYLLYISSDNKIFLIERIVGLILAGIFLLLLMSIFSYTPDYVLANLGGKFGYQASSFLIRTLGYIISVYTCLVLLIYGFLVFINRPRKSFLVELSALFIAFFSITIFLPPPLSGGLSQKISSALQTNFGIAGRIIFTIVLIALAALVFEFPKILKWRKPKEKEIVERYDTETRLEKAEIKRTEITKNRKRLLEKEFQPGEESFDPLSLISLLKPAEPFDATESKQELEKNKLQIEEKLKEFGIEGKVINYFPGPVVTRYEYEPAPGVKLSRISALSDDIALRMRSNAIRIVAPLPNKGLVGFEIPNKNRKTVFLRSLVERDEFLNLDSPLAFALGVDTAGNPVYADLAYMPHLLIAGSTGSGKSVCINTIITSIIFRNLPSKVRFILIDPKRIELSLYEGIPHLLLPVVKDRKLAVDVLKKTVKWMDFRYKLFAKEGARDITSYNEKIRKNGGDPIPYIVIIIDEFADLIITTGREIEEPLARLAQMARAVGIHLVVATQRPSVDVITGMIKANFPVRIAFKVPSRVDSKTILDEKGAEKLLGRGDMLFIPPGTSEPLRLHGPLISEEETKRISKFLVKSYLGQIFKAYFRTFEGDLEGLIDEFMDENLFLSLIRTDEPGFEELEARAVEFISDTIEMDEQTVKNKIEEIRENYYRKIPEMTEIPLGQPEEEVELQEGEWDSMLEEAARAVVLEGKASATLLQRRLKLGFARAARVIDQLEQIGIIGPQEGTKPRKVLVKLDDLDRIFKSRGNQ